MSSTARLVTVFLAGLVIAVASIIVLFFPQWVGRTPPPVEQSVSHVFAGKIRNVESKEERVFRLSYSNKDWPAHAGLRTRLKVIHVVERAGGKVWLAFTARDYGAKKPRDTDLLKVAFEILEGGFGETLELATSPTAAEVAGHSAQAIEFRGRIDDSVWRGECHTFTTSGVGYWIIAAGSSLNEARLALADFQKDGGFAVINERPVWREQPRKPDSFDFGSLPFRLKASEGIWKPSSAIDEDQHGELFLRATYDKDKNNRKYARVLVLALPKQPDLSAAVTAARDYVEMAEKSVTEDYRLMPLDEGKDQAKRSRIGDLDGTILELKLQLRDEPQRYVLLAVIHEPTNVIAFRCECTWENRQLWRQEFFDLLAGLERKK